MTVEVRGLSRAYGGRPAVSRLSFCIAPGEVVGLLGPNGAGKSTTMRCVAGLLEPDDGEVIVGGARLRDDPARVRAQVGYLSERTPLWDDLRVAEHVRLVGALRGASADDLLDALGLDAVANTLVGRLSKGWRQRVGLACALVGGPAVLLLDEPSSGLDPGQRVELRRIVRAEAAKGRAVVLSSHVLGEVEAVCDRALLLSNGALVADVSVGDDGTRLHLRVAAPRGLAAALDGIGRVEERDDGAVVALRPGFEADDRAAAIRAALPHDLLSAGPPRDLEAAYLRLIGGGVG